MISIRLSWFDLHPLPLFSTRVANDFATGPRIDPSDESRAIVTLRKGRKRDVGGLLLEKHHFILLLQQYHRTASPLLWGTLENRRLRLRGLGAGGQGWYLTYFFGQA